MCGGGGEWGSFSGVDFAFDAFSYEREAEEDRTVRGFITYTKTIHNYYGCIVRMFY